MKKRIIITNLIVITLLTACSTNNTTVKKSGIEINAITTSIGAVKNNTNDFNAQSYKYTITLTNNDIEDLAILSVQPTINSKLVTRVLNTETLIHVNKTIVSEDSLEITGEIIFDASDLTKEQIIELEPFIEDIKITEERIIKKSF